MGKMQFRKWKNSSTKTIVEWEIFLKGLENEGYKWKDERSKGVKIHKY